jgi:hypothetical protein
MYYYLLLPLRLSIKIITIQLNSCLLTSKLKSPGANYKVSTSTQKETTKNLQIKYKTVYIIIIIATTIIIFHMIKDNVLCSEYVNVPGNNISSCCWSSRGTIFTRGADIEQTKVSDVPSRNSKTNNFQNRKTEFRTKLNLNKKECI